MSEYADPLRALYDDLMEVVLPLFPRTYRPRHATEADLAEKRARAYGYLERRRIARYQTDCRHHYRPHAEDYVLDARVEVTVCRHYCPHPTVHIATRG